jgi:hypothetical protein
MKNILVKFSDNWADEMEIVGYKIFKEDDWYKFKEQLINYKESWEHYVGTNEYLMFASGQDFLDRCEDDQEVTDEFLKEYYNLDLDIDPYQIIVTTEDRMNGDI